MLEEREVGETQILAAFIGVSEMVGNLTDLEEILRTVVRIAPQLVRVDRCAIFLYDPGARECVPAVAYCPRPSMAEPLLQTRLKEDDAPKLIRKVVHQKLPSVIRDLPQEDMLPQEIIKGWGVNSMLVIPLVAKGQTQGIMTLDSTTSRHYFTSKEINVVTGIANQVATAVENGKLNEEALRAYSKIAGIVEELADAVISVDGSMRVTALSNSGMKFLGWSAKDLSGQSWAKLLKPRDANGRLLEEMDFLRGTLANGELSKGQKAFVMKGNGAKVFCSIRALALRGRGSQASYLFFVFKKSAIPRKKREDGKEAE